MSVNARISDHTRKSLIFDGLMVYFRHMKKVTKIRHKNFLYIAALLFVLSSPIASAFHNPRESFIDIGIDLAGILVGIAVTTYMLSLLKSFKGALRKAFYFMMLGIFFQILALIQHVLADWGVHTNPLNIDIHHIIMTIGIIIFAIAAYNLRKMMSELDEKS